MKNYVAIVGGGLAGLTAAIHLSKMGVFVTVFEKNVYPKHKVCGEYISNEVLPYLQWLNIEIASLKPTNITKLEISLASGQVQKVNLPLGGFGISRYELDNYLYKLASHNGCKFVNETVADVDFGNDEFTISTTSDIQYKARIVLGAFGKRSNLDRKMERKFTTKKAPWLAVKGHYRGNFPDNLVGLHHFEGGYCGVSKVENDIINICYITDYESFQKYKDIESFEKHVVRKNVILKDIFEKYVNLFDKPITISQISFASKKAVENHILMIGDTAGLIHPLCGNGMAMAMHSAKLASEATLQFFNNVALTRNKLEENYIKSWNYNFKNRIIAGRLLSKILQKPLLASFVMKIVIRFPYFLKKIIKRTHGSPIIVHNSGF